MNQIQAAPYQPSFSHPHGMYPQQPHFASPAPQHFHPSSHPQSQPQHPLAHSTSQSPLASPSAQAFRPPAASPTPPLTSPHQQQHPFQHQPPHQQQQHFQARPAPGNGAVSSFGGQSGPNQPSLPDQSSQPGNLTPSRATTFAPSTGSAPAQVSSSSQQQQQQQQQQRHPGSASPQKYPMAAPPLPPSVQRQQSPHSGSNPAVSQPSSPRAAASSALERERVALLLDINLILLEEMNRLLARGHGGAVSQQQAAMLRNQGMSDKMATEEYTQTFYRLQANLAYLYSQPDMQALNPQKQNQPQPGNKGPPHPPHFVHAPPHMPWLDDKYAALRALFPGWQGKDGSGDPSGPASSS